MRRPLVRRGLVVVEAEASGRGRSSTVVLAFAASGPWWEGEINVELLEAVLGYSGATGVARLLLAAMAAIADADGAVRDFTTEQICAAAGIAAKGYQRAKRELLGSGELVLVHGVGGRGNTNAWVVADPRGGTAPSLGLVIAQQTGGVGKTTTAANLVVLLARRDRRVLAVDTDPQFALTRQLGLEIRSLGVNLVDVLAGRAAAADAIVGGVHGFDVIPAARELAGVEMSLVGEMGRELFLRDALEPVLGDYDHVVVDTPPNLGLLTVNALVCAGRVLAPVSAEDEASLHGIVELRQTIARLSERFGVLAPDLVALLTRWQRHRIGSREMDDALIAEGLTPVGRTRLDRR